MKASALTVLAMAAAKHPEIVAPHVDHAAGVLELACTKKKPTLARAAASLLKCARPGGNAGTPDSMGVAAPALAPDAPAFAALAKVLSPCSPLPGRGWYPAAEQSIAALYALHPDPEGAAGDVLRSFAAAAFSGRRERRRRRRGRRRRRRRRGKSQRRVPRAVPLRPRRSRAPASRARGGPRARRPPRAQARATDRAAAEASEAAAAAGKRARRGGRARRGARAGRRRARTLALDNAREACEAELLSFSVSQSKKSAVAGRGLVAAYAPVVVALCGHPAVAAGHALLRGAALAALSRLMAIDAEFCEAHLALIFTRARGGERPRRTRGAHGGAGRPRVPVSQRG